MKYFKIISIITMLLASISSCRTVVDWELEDGESSLAIESYITNEIAPWYVHIEKTRSYFDNEPATAVETAMVTISDDAGNVDTLDYWADGYYESRGNKACVPGRNYTLEVGFEGKTYVSSELCREQLPIDTFFFFYQPVKNGFILPGYYVFELAQEIDNPNDYYQWIITKNDTIQDDFGYILDTDEFADFSYFNSNIDLDNITLEYLPRPFPFDFELGDRVKLEQRCINKNYYEYLSEFQTQYDRQGSPFDAPPSNPTGNISGAFGYFAVMNVQTAELVISE